MKDVMDAQVVGIQKSNTLNFDDNLKVMREYAVNYHVPIIKDDGLMLLSQVIKLSNCKEVLEIGTAIGYSAINMAKLGCHVISIERDQEMYDKAIENINKSNCKENIGIIFGDALEQFEILKDKKFDLIFIDAAKGQYKKFFELYTPLLNTHGVVLCDNMIFHNSVNMDTTQMSRSLRGLVNKLKNFTEFLINNEDFDTTIYEIGDGMAVSIKR
ncbi:MAG: O-methyltransferase [Acholeplasmatales bacterium]|nr:O-methyltransferase [Acholeplasmatales bacterium]